MQASLEKIYYKAIIYRRYGNGYRLTTDLVLSNENCEPPVYRQQHPLELVDIDVDEYLTNGQILLRMKCNMYNSSRPDNIILYIKNGQWWYD